MCDIIFAVVKGIFKQDDVYQVQVSLILSELVTYAGDKIPQNILQPIKDVIYRLKTSHHSENEIEKLVKNYVPQVFKVFYVYLIKYKGTKRPVS